MNEQYSGSLDERHYIAEHLLLLRSLKPHEMLLNVNAISLSDARAHNLADIDFALLVRILNDVRRKWKGSALDRIEFVKESRYFIVEPKEAEIGGFHGEYSVGHHTMWAAACVSVLNAKIIASRALRTIELARSILHDAVHASTFCRYRLHRPSPATKDEPKFNFPEIYREQYGVNFRNAWGVSYSDPKLTRAVPYAINLNLLMDGIGVIMIADMLSRAEVDKHLPDDLSTTEQQVLDEILIRVGPQGPGPWGKKFFFDVISPTRIFLQYWGGTEFQETVFAAMITGELSALRSAFASRHGDPNAWEIVFRQDAYRS